MDDEVQVRERRVRPLYSREAIDTTPTGPRLNRRETGLIKRLRRFWWNLVDGLGVVAYILVWGLAIILLGSASIWLWSDLLKAVR